MQDLTPSSRQANDFRGNLTTPSLLSQLKSTLVWLTVQLLTVCFPLNLMRAQFLYVVILPTRMDDLHPSFTVDINSNVHPKNCSQNINMLTDDKFPTSPSPSYIPLTSSTSDIIVGGEPQELDLVKLFANLTVVITCAPGAFTPTCTQAHIPAYLSHQKQFKARGVDRVIIMCNNDPFVMNAWARALGYKDDDNYFVFATDPNAEISAQLGDSYVLDLTKKGMGKRTARYSAIVKNGKISYLEYEPEGKYGNAVGVNDVLEKLEVDEN